MISGKWAITCVQNINEQTARKPVQRNPIVVCTFQIIHQETKDGAFSGRSHRTPTTL